MTASPTEPASSPASRSTETGAGASPHAVVTDDRPPDSDPVVDTAFVRRIVEGALTRAGVTGAGEVAVTLVEPDTIAELNRDHLGGTGPTDVLSFPMDGPGDDDPLPPGAPRLLGDLVICPAVAAAQAPQHAGSLEDELALLSVHGVLHLLGWDHAEADEARAMRATEAAIVAAVHRPVAAGTEVP